MIDKINLQRFLILASFVSGAALVLCVQQTMKKDFDCISDYKDYVVVDRDGKDYIIANGCDFSTVSFPAAYKLNLNDTIGVKPKITARQKEMLEYLQNGENRELLYERFKYIKMGEEDE